MNEGHAELLILLSFLVAVYSAAVLIYAGCAYAGCIVTLPDWHAESLRLETLQTLANHRNDWLLAGAGLIVGLLQAGFGAHLINKRKQALPWRKKCGYPE